MEKRTELEYFVLAMVSEMVNSGYAIKKQLQGVRGGRWNAESGATYRVLRRLTEDQLITVSGKAGAERRERTEYSITSTGKKVLADWMLVNPDFSEYAFLVDSIRTRSYFLPCIPKAERVKVVKKWIETNKFLIKSLKEDLIRLSVEDDPIRNTGAEHLIYSAQARHNWLKDLLAICEKLEDSDFTTNHCQYLD